MSGSKPVDPSRKRERWVVGALLLAVVAVWCGQVEGTRHMKPSSPVKSPPPPPPSPWQSPPPNYTQPSPSPIPSPHSPHHARPYQGPPPPPVALSPPPTPPSVHRSPPPSLGNRTLSSPPPPIAVPNIQPPPPSRYHNHQSPPPPSSTTSGGGHSPHTLPSIPGRKLFGTDLLLDSDFLLQNEHTKEEQIPMENGLLVGKCNDPIPEVLSPASAPSVSPRVPSPYGSGYAPVGSPFFPPAVTGMPNHAPAPTSGSDDPYTSAAPSPPSSSNKTLAHTTMVSAMKDNQCTYTIVTSTGNIEGAGTTADVNVEFFDKFGNSVLFVNLKSQSRNFERGTTDTFTVVGDCVRSICRMHLSHDDSGPDPSWFVNTVTVSLMYQTHVFNVYEWLSKTEPPYSLTRTISSCPA